MTTITEKGFSVPLFLITGALLLFAGIFVYKNPPIYNPPLPLKSTDPTRPTPFPSPFDNFQDLDKTKHYINYKFNFQLDIPKNWSKTDTIEEYNPARFTDNPNTSQYPINAVNLSIFVHQIFATEIENYHMLFNEYQKITIAGFNAIKYLKNPKPNSEPYWEQIYLIKKEPKLYYELKFGSANQTSLKNNQKVIDQIVLSFNFLEKEARKYSLIEYKNDDLGYSFNYPSNWRVNTFQNNGDYNKGITIINEDHQEILSLYQESPYQGYCPPIADPKKTWLGNKEVIVKTDCNNPRVKTSKGYEFRANLPSVSENTDPHILELLKSIKGLSILN